MNGRRPQQPANHRLQAQLPVRAPSTVTTNPSPLVPSVTPVHSVPSVTSVTSVPLGGMYQAAPSYQQEHERMIKSMLEAKETKTVELKEPNREPIKEAAQPVREPIKEAAQPIREPIREAAQPIREPIKETAQPVREPIREAQAVKAPQPVREAPQAPKGPVAEAAAAPTVKAKRARAAPKTAKTTKAKADPPIAEPQIPTADLEIIKRYIQLDDEIKALKDRKKQMEETLSQLEDQVRNILQPLAAPVKTGNSVLRVKEKQVKETVTKGFLTAKLAESGELKDPARAPQIIEEIYKSCKVKSTKQEVCRNKK